MTMLATNRCALRPVAGSLAVLLLLPGGVAAAAEDEGRGSTDAAAEGGASAAPAAEADTDHGRVVGHFAVGFQGTRFVPAALPHPVHAVQIDAKGSATLTIVEDGITVPLVGARYWLTRIVGVDLGIGFNTASGATERKIPNPDASLDATTDTATPTTVAFAGRLGVPLSVYTGKHYGFVLMPELDIGYSATTYEAFDVSTTGSPLDLKVSGFVFGASARAGAEVSFGFIDVPQLSLQAAVGIRVESRRRAGKIGDAEMTMTNTEVGTSWYGAPWDVLASSLAAYYYF